MSRVMRVSVLMMREAKHERALDGAAGVGRLETGAHKVHYRPLMAPVKGTRLQCHFSQGGSGRSLERRNSGLNSRDE
jgi:hypothetical protein